MILIPVKSLANAKQRLASVLDQSARTKLAQAMLFDVLETLGTWVSRPEVSIVTSDPFALDLARRFEFQIIADNTNRSQTDAIEMATGYRADFHFGDYDPTSKTVSVNDLKLSRLDPADKTQPAKDLYKTTLNLKVGQTYIFATTKKGEKALVIVLAARK